MTPYQLIEDQKNTTNSNLSLFFKYTRAQLGITHTHTHAHTPTHTHTHITYVAAKLANAF